MICDIKDIPLSYLYNAIHSIAMGIIVSYAMYSML
jgi:hypothetical protein